jgi:hypothetical protein
MTTILIEQAKKDIYLGIESDIVHKYVLDNASDIQSVIQLYHTSCNLSKNNSNYLFGFLHIISHTMVNPRVIDEINNLAIECNGDYDFIFNYIHREDVRKQWNTEQFHQEMNAVASNYKECGGFLENNIHDGVAYYVFNNKDKIQKVSQYINVWLNKDVAYEDELIGAIYDLNIPGMNMEYDGYWLLHLCRGASVIRQKICKKITHQSMLYLDMIGVKLFRDKYDNLQLEHMPELYEHCKDLVKKYTDVVFTYGDFGCLTCELHRLISEFKKNNHGTFREDIENVINNRRNEWMQYKQQRIEDDNLAPSIENSARSNVNIFINFMKL